MVDVQGSEVGKQRKMQALVMSAWLNKIKYKIASTYVGSTGEEATASESPWITSTT